MGKKTKKKFQKLDISQLINQRLRADLSLTEDQIEIINNVLHGYMPVEDAEFASGLGKAQEQFTPPPGLTIDMEDGTEQTITLANHPLFHMYGYLIEHYGEKFGVIYWGALTSIGKQQQFYGFLGHMKKNLGYS
jgi:hypothetical protein